MCPCCGSGGGPRVMCRGSLLYTLCPSWMLESSPYRHRPLVPGGVTGRLGPPAGAASGPGRRRSGLQRERPVSLRLADTELVTITVTEVAPGVVGLRKSTHRGSRSPSSLGTGPDGSPALPGHHWSQPETNQESGKGEGPPRAGSERQERRSETSDDDTYPTHRPPPLRQREGRKEGERRVGCAPNS